MTAAAVAGIGTAHPRDVPRATTPSATLLCSDGGRGRAVPPGERLRPAALASAGGTVGLAAAPALLRLLLSSAAAPTKDRRFRDGGAPRERGVRLRDRSSSGGELERVPRSRCGVAVTGRRRTSVWRWQAVLAGVSARAAVPAGAGSAAKATAAAAAAAVAAAVAAVTSACSGALAASSAAHRSIMRRRSRRARAFGGSSPVLLPGRAGGAARVHVGNVPAVGHRAATSSSAVPKSMVPSVRRSTHRSVCADARRAAMAASSAGRPAGRVGRVGDASGAGGDGACGGGGWADGGGGGAAATCAQVRMAATRDPAAMAARMAAAVVLWDTAGGGFWVMQGGVASVGVRVFAGFTALARVGWVPRVLRGVWLAGWRFRRRWRRLVTSQSWSGGLEEDD